MSSGMVAGSEDLELDAAIQSSGMTVLLGRPGLNRDEMFLRFMCSAMLRGRVLVLHSKPFVRAERLLQLLGGKEELLSRAVFHRMPTFESQESALRRLDVDSAKMETNSVFFDSPTDNYLVSLALAVDSAQTLKRINASMIRQFAYLKDVSTKNIRVLLTMGNLYGINTIEEYLLRHWPDLIINIREAGEVSTGPSASEPMALSRSSARVITVLG